MDKSVAVIGYGQFGELLVSLLEKYTKYHIYVLSSRDLTFNSQRVNLAHKEIITKCEFIFPCVPIYSLLDTIDTIKPFISSETTLVDVSSIKMYPKKLYSEYIPKIPVILTHPMFGPGTLAEKKDSTKGLRIVMENLSASQEKYHELHKIFVNMELTIVKMSAEEHDKAAARFHFLSQYIAQILKNLDLQPGPIDTGSYEQLLTFMKMIRTDKRLLFEMMEYNPYCKEQLLEIENISHNLSKDLLAL